MAEQDFGVVLHGERVLLRPVRADDLRWLRAAVAAPTVAAWWDDGSGTAWVDGLLDDDEVVGLVAEADAERIGYGQYSEEPDPAYRHAAVDLFVVEGHQGRGNGQDILRTLAHWLVTARGHHRLEIDPSAGNERAIRCYAAVGFRPIGLARRRERGADGTWRDSLLMDVLADELT